MLNFFDSLFERRELVTEYSFFKKILKIIANLPQKNTSSATTQNCKVKPSYVCQWYSFEAKF
jgi:hypothetical protein